MNEEMAHHSGIFCHWGDNCSFCTFTVFLTQGKTQDLRLSQLTPKAGAASSTHCGDGPVSFSG